MHESNRGGGPNTWDFFTGRGAGATRADRASVRWQFAARALGLTLARDDGFNGFADELGGADVTQARLLSAVISRRYWPRRGRRQAVIARMLWIAAGEPDRRIFRLVNAGGPLTYFPDGSPSGPNCGYAVRHDYERMVVRGAELVARRGGGRCLECDGQLAGLREPVCGPIRQTSRRVDYCCGCTARPEHELRAPLDLRAMEDTLRDAAAFIFRG